MNDSITLSPNRETEKKQKLRLEPCVWKRTAVGMMALNVVVSAGLCGAIAQKNAVIAEQDAKIEQWQTRYNAAAAIERDVVQAYGDLVMQMEADKQVREEQAAVEEETQKSNLNPTVTANIIEDCTITYYCAEKYPHICGLGLGITATGAECNPGHIVAVDPNVIPLHSKVIVDYGDGELHCYFAEDVGGSVKGDHIDVMCETHDDALNAGITTATVYWIEQEDHQ